MTIDIEGLQERIAGLVGQMSFDQAVDAIHRELRTAGVGEGDALAVNAAILDLLKPTLPRFSTFELFVTRWCNLDCAYCFVHSKEPLHMPDDVVREAAEFIARERDPHTQTKVVFMGGEPTSRFASIRSVIERLEEGIGGPNADLLRFDITSNGTLLTEEMVRYFSSHNVMVLLSVDGARESHNAKRIFVGGGGSFDALRQGIQLLKRYQGYLGTKMTPTPETASALLEDVKAVVGMGFRRILIGPATGVPWDEEALAVLRTSLASVIKWKQGITLPGLYVSLDEGGEETALCGQDNRWGCRAGRTGLAIDIDGSLSPCSKIIGTSNPGGAVLRLGTVYEGVTNNATRLKLNGYTPTERVRCWSCDLRTACHGGCYAANVEATGNPFEPAPFNCKVTEAVLQAQRDAREK